MASDPLGPEPGWTPVNPFPTLAPPRPFIPRDGADGRLGIRYYRRADGELVAKVWFGPGCEGSEGHAHGGAILSVLDEALGAEAWIRGHIVMTGRLTVRFRRMVALGTVARLEASLKRVEAKRVIVHGRLIDSGGRVLADGDGVFVRTGPAGRRAARSR